MPYTVSNTNANLQTLSTTLASAVDAVAAYAPKLLYLKRTISGENYKKYLNAVAEGTEATVQTEIAAQYVDKSFIDPFTAYAIFDQVLWPSISVISPGWSENPYNADANIANAEFYMRGVPVSDIFTTSNDFSKNFENVFGVWNENGALPVGFLDKTKKIDQLKAIYTAYSNLLNGYKGTTRTLVLQKDVLYTVFSSENAAKCHFISIYLNGFNTSDNNTMPCNMLLIDPYLAYLIVLFTWLGGIGARDSVHALDRFAVIPGIFTGTLTNMRAAINALSTDYQWHNLAIEKRPETATLAINLLTIFYSYVQQKKTDQAEFYKNWMEMLITSRKSMINMLVIVNERVNINNAKSFPFQQKAGEYQIALSEAYKKFTMEIAD